jgi:hypothetical protein
MSQREGIHIITSGTSATINNGAGTIFMDLASLAATFTLTMPSSPSDQDIVTIFFGGTITAGTVVTAFTLSANSGQTILGTALSATAALFSSCFRFQWRNATGQWYRIQ